MTISLDVNMVKTDTKIYRIINKNIWDLPAIFTDFAAKNLKNPASSKNIEMNVIEKKRIRILIGLILADVSNKFTLISLKFTSPKTTIKIAPIKATIQ